MTPTIEEVKKVAIEHGARLNYRQFNMVDECYLHGFETLEQLQAFTQHWMKVQREQDAKYLESRCDIPGNEQSAEAIRNNTGE